MFRMLQASFLTPARSASDCQWISLDHKQPTNIFKNLLKWIFHCSNSHKLDFQIHKLIVKHFLNCLIAIVPTHWYALLIGIIVDAIKAVDDRSVTIAGEEWLIHQRSSINIVLFTHKVFKIGDGWFCKFRHFVGFVSIFQQSSKHNAICITDCSMSHGLMIHMPKWVQHLKVLQWRIE